MTALGAAGVFATREVNQKLLNAMLGGELARTAAGVMIAASYWSLLAPAIEISQSMGVPGWIPAAIGFLFGGAFLWGIDKLLPHLHAGLPDGEAEGIKTSWQRIMGIVSVSDYTA
jgi:ZIP family zinc transporter